MLSVNARLNVHLRSLVDQAFATLPRVYLVRWHDEDRGWRSMQVIANSKQDAMDTAGLLTSGPVEVYQSAV